MREPNGLLAAGGDLSADRLIEAYHKGIFPWYSEGQPVLWWSPDPRMVLHLDEFKLSRSLTKTLRRLARGGDWTISHNRCFERVMRECSQPRDGQDGTWITDDIVAAYGQLHQRGLAHSVEVWDGNELIGGLYGVALGRMFYGESMFARRTDASKIALSALVAFCRRNGIRLIDCQQHTRHLASLGARTIPRHAFEVHLSDTVDAETPRWTYDESLWTELGLRSATPPIDPP